MWPRNDQVAAPWQGGSAFWVLLIASTAFSFWELFPNGLRAEAMGPFPGLTFAAILIALAGWAVSVLCNLDIFLRGNLALHIGLGQISILVWVFFRSVLNAVVEQTAGLALPVTRLELLLLILTLVWRASRKKTILTLKSGSSCLPWICVVLFIIAQRELPREIMLSSDPDQHLFFASRILSFGAIPFHLGSWGPLDFNYPAGFAALSAIWSWLGAVSPSNALTVQPMVQTVLALLAISFIAAGMLSKKSALLSIVSGYFVLVLFFGFFPYTLTSEFFFLEKTGSISSLLMMVTTAILAVYGGFGPRDRSIGPALLLSAAGVGLSAHINPVAAIVPGIVFFTALLRVGWERRASTGAALRAIAIYGAAPFLVTLTDPYYMDRLVRSGSPILIDSVTETPRLQNVFAAAAARMSEIGTGLEWLRPFLLISFFGLNPLSIAVITVATFVFVSLLPEEERRRAILFISVVPLLILVLEFTAGPGFFAIRGKGGYDLLEPYLVSALERLAYLWLMGVLVLALTQCFLRFSSIRAGSALTIAAFTILMIPVRYARNTLPNSVRMEPRVNRCDYSLGCASDDDHLIFGALREHFSAYVAGGGRTGFRDVPKILVPNAVLKINNEDWVMPVGGARLLPLVPTYPAAFYYSRGSIDYGYQNYLDHVCRRLDLEWLKERNIRFLFVPSQRPRVCLAGLDSLLASGRILARAGNAALMELY